jgi:hypothetical protein
MKVIRNDVEGMNSNYLYVEAEKEEDKTDIANFAQEWLDKEYEAMENEISVKEVWYNEDSEEYRVQWTWNF